MKKTVLILLVLFFSIPIFAQDANDLYLWPIQGEKAGANIIYAPQSYIDKELNFGDLIISAPEGTNVISPVDGTVTSFAPVYYENDHIVAYKTASPTIDGGINEVKSGIVNGVVISFEGNPKYLSGIISIECDNGQKIYISGLRGDVPFKKGQKIKKGDIIGTVSYFSQKIKQSSIRVSIYKGSEVADPMTPFGIKSTFIPKEKNEEKALWPIQGEKAGTGIIYPPQSYIDKELNFGGLIITAPEGTNVVSPVDGVIDFFSVIYLDNLETSTVYRITSSTFDGGISEITKSFDNDPKYLNGYITIKCDNGIKVYLSGLRGNIPFKTGQKIKKGDVIGTVGYFYHKIKEPSIKISFSSGDPMTPFGIKSTYIPYDEVKPVTSLTKEQAKEDFLISINALKEAFPGFYDVLSEEEINKYVSETLDKINAFEGDLQFRQFLYIMRSVIARIHDSHVGLIYPSWFKMPPQEYLPKVWIGWINDTLICLNSVEKYKHLIGKEILSVNGIKADDAKKIISDNVDSYDAKVEDYVKFRLAYFGFADLFRKESGDYNYDMVLELADGQKVNIESGITGKDAPKFVNSFNKFMLVNRRLKDNYALKTLNDSTAYIGLSSFAFNQVQIEKIGAFIDSISDMKHLIIDIRNNGGGRGDVVDKLFSFIAEKPSVSKGYQMVNKKGGFDCFEYSTNYRGIKEDIFPEYTRRADGKYYAEPEFGKEIKPDSLINYKGKVYVLTNEYSVSAATLFPALVIRNGRGVVVGRETSTAYHFMNAVKFVKVRLPNSTIVVNIPMVKVVFDDVVNERVPYGRGVVPDYHVPVSLDELTFMNGDAILNYTLKLIESGQYLPNSPFRQENKN